MPIKMKSAKAKGKALEKRVAETVAEWLGMSVDDFVRARGGTDECDIGRSSKAREVFPYHLECKNQKTLSIPAWLRQAEEACAKYQKEDSPEDTPVIVFKQYKQSKLYAVISFDAFMELATRFLNEQRKVADG